MKIERVAGVDLVLGLEWPDKLAFQDRDMAVEAFAARKQVDPVRIRYVVSESKVGAAPIRVYGMASQEDEYIPQKALALSVLCAGRGDGVYAAMIQQLEGQVVTWVCSVSDGVVISESLVPRDEAKMIVSGLALLKNKPVFVTRGTGITQIGAATVSTFDLETFISTLTPEAAAAAMLKRMPGAANRRMGPLIIIPVLLVVAIGGFLFYRRYKAEKAIEAQQQAVIAARNAYLASAPGAIGPIPDSPLWAQSAVETSMAKLPPFLDGFDLALVQCTPGHCDAAYFTEKDSPYSFDRFKAHFAKPAVVTFVNGRGTIGAKVVIPVKMKSHMANAGLLVNPPAERHGAWDWVGAEIHSAMPGKLQSSPVVVNIASVHGGTSANMPPLFMTTVSVDGDEYMSPQTARSLALAGSIYGFFPSMIEWSPGIAGKGSSYRMTFEQINRNDPSQ